MLRGCRREKLSHNQFILIEFAFIVAKYFRLMQQVAPEKAFLLEEKKGRKLMCLMHVRKTVVYAELYLSPNMNLIPQVNLVAPADSNKDI